MEIRQILKNKRAFLPLLLLGDEQESLIEGYLSRSTLFALYDGGVLRAVCAVAEEGGGIFEIKNLAVAPEAQRRGYGRRMVESIVQFCRERGGCRLLAGTGDSPLTMPFYASCGFRELRRVPGYFPARYDHPIWEGGKLLRDLVVFALDFTPLQREASVISSPCIHEEGGSLMYYYWMDGALAASFLPDLPLPSAPEGRPERFLLRRDPLLWPAAWRVTDSRQLTAEDAGAFQLDPRRMGEPPALPEAVGSALAAGTLTAVNLRHPRCRRALRFITPQPGKKRVHLLAVGDVGGTLLTALKLLGGDAVSSIGICDLNENTVARWTAEMGQIAWPWDYDALPEVEPVAPERLFDCDVFLFAAAKAIPAVGSGVQDVRMAQLEANRPLAEHFARQAREADFRGLFLVLSDPVDLLCQAAWQASNTGPDGRWDHLGLLPEQIQGFGLGVMNARAAYFAKRDPRFAAFLAEGRSFGPHGQGLVIADSIAHYNDELSRELTQLALEANLRIRDLGFKPYAAPAVSSGAMQLLLALRGDWHCGSIPLGGIWFGCRTRFTAHGLEIETLNLPDPLFARLRETERALRELSEAPKQRRSP